MSILHRANDVTLAVIGVLEAAGLLVGDAVKPAGGGWAGAVGDSAFTPYVVVYNLVGGSTGGTLEHSDSDASPTYQFTSTGANRAQTEMVADAARAAILTAAIELPGRKVALCTIDMLGGATRDDDEQPPVWWSPDRYRLVIVPAP